MVTWTLQTFYRSKDWEKFRQIIISQRTNPDNGLLYCEHCGKPIARAYDIILHHKVELTPANVNDRAVSLNPDNVMCVHHRCHNEIHKRFGFGRPAPRKVYIVYGPPCAGKSTWVREVAGKEDLIVDIDRIWQMVSNNPPYIKPVELKGCVFAVRDTLMDCIKNRRGKWMNAYIVGGYPIAREREDLAASIPGAELVPILETEQECLARLQQTEDGRDKAAWAEYIADWFSKSK